MIGFLIPVLVVLYAGFSNFSQGAVRERIDLGFYWRFASYEIYNDAEAREPLRRGPEGLEAPDYDDSQWLTVNVPHDWAIEGDYAPNHPTRDNAGYLRAGIGNPIDVEPHFNVSSRTAFFGLAKAFVEATRESGPITLFAAAVVGEKRQITSDIVSIDVQQIALRGSHAAKPVEIFYTTDDTKPTRQSTRYQGAFSIAPGTTVRAAVFVNSVQILDLQERFSANDGFYWGNQTAEKMSLTDSMEHGAQAEAAQLAGSARQGDQGGGFHGSGYVELPAEGAITWFSENDGSPADYDLSFCYAGEDKQGGRRMRSEVNGKVVVPSTLLKNTGDWNTGWETWTTRQRLQQGSNEIRLSTTGRGGMNIDELIVKPVDTVAE